MDEETQENLGVKSCYKVVTCDIADEIVMLHSSLMVGVARQMALRQ